MCMCVCMYEYVCMYACMCVYVCMYVHVVYTCTFEGPSTYCTGGWVGTTAILCVFIF